MQKDVTSKEDESVYRSIRVTPDFQSENNIPVVNVDQTRLPQNGDGFLNPETNRLNEPSFDNSSSSSSLTIETTPIRFLMLLVFSLDTIVSNLTYSLYPIIGDVVSQYYNVPQSTVNWSSMVIFFTFVVAFLPSVWMFEKVGLKVGLCVGTTGIAIGYWILCGSFDPSRFWVIILGQGIVGACQVCFFTVSSRVASVWFGSDEVSRACAVGVFSNMLGVGLSCIIPPMVVTSSDPETIRAQLSHLNYGLACCATLTALLTFFVLKEQPLNPPSQSQALLRKEASTTSSNEKQAELETNGGGSFIGQLRGVLGNRNYLLQMVSSGLVFAMGNTVATSMNEIVLSRYPNAQKDVGVLGLLTVLCGIPAGLVYGTVLDKTHKYKELAIAVVIGSLLALALFAGSLYWGIAVVYVACVMIGVFMAGYPTVGFDMAVEVSYPATEILSAGLLMCFGNTVSVPIIYFSNWMISNVGVLYNNLVYVGIMSISLICAFCVKADLRRLAANQHETTTLESSWRPNNIMSVNVIATVDSQSQKSLTTQQTYGSLSTFQSQNTLITSP